MTDPHPAIKTIATNDGWEENADIHPEAFKIYQRAKSLLCTPQERVQALRTLDTIIGAEDGTSLKSKAELLNLRRGLSETHHNLLKAGR